VRQKTPEKLSIWIWPRTVMNCARHVIFVPSQTQCSSPEVSLRTSWIFLCVTEVHQFAMSRHFSCSLPANSEDTHFWEGHILPADGKFTFDILYIVTTLRLGFVQLTSTNRHLGFNALTIYNCPDSHIQTWNLSTRNNAAMQVKDWAQRFSNDGPIIFNTGYIYIYICICIYVCIYICIYLPTYLSTYLSIYPSIHLSIYLILSNLFQSSLI
jgi:hypothetical protein